MKLLLKNAQINGKVQNLLIHNQIIDYIGDNTPDNDWEIDLIGKIIIPGVIDPHTHIRDLNQKDKEDWTSASKAAIAGGTTMVFDMPNNNPPIVNLKYLNMKREVAKAAQIHYRFHIAATAHNLDDIAPMLDSNEGDIVGLKLFLAGSNSNEYVNDKEIIKRIFDLGLQYDMPVVVHTEWQSCIEKHTQSVEAPSVFKHNRIRHPECAVKGTEIVAQLASEIGNKLYIAHTSLAGELEIIRRYKDKARIYAEVSPHHLLLNDYILHSVGNFGKVNPPLRSPDDNKALWKAVDDGTIDCLGTDHAPHLVSEKMKDYPQAPSGFPGLETHLPLMLHEINRGNLDLNRLVEMNSQRVAEIFNIQNTGALIEGYFADLAVADMRKRWKIKPEHFKTKAKYSPFAGFRGKGDVVMTFVNGRMYVK